MKYEVIARRYRPLRFEEVVGQESVSQTLRGGILQERMAHAYLFCGPRGVGKTSMARIFAKALNCPSAANRDGDRESWARPCNECSLCKGVHTGQDIDVIEMDGASNRGIDDIRQIVEGVNRPASRSPYKIYIIDEVHMLTREAFNALLKTLEEPPAHVKFIFATTEAHKIPDTVLSRCQRFDFQPIGPQDIARRLAQICESEGREADEAILLKIAQFSKGGLRDSQTLLDQLMTYSDGKLAEEDLERLTGRVSDQMLGELVAAVLERDAARVLELCRECFAMGTDASILIEQVIETLHGELSKAVESGEDESRVDRMVGSLQILLEAAARLRRSAFPEIAVELVLIKLARLEDPRGFQRALEQIVRLESEGGSAASPAAPPAAGSTAMTSAPVDGPMVGPPAGGRIGIPALSVPPAATHPPAGPPAAMQASAGPPAAMQASAGPPSAMQASAGPPSVAQPSVTLESAGMPSVSPSLSTRQAAVPPVAIPVSPGEGPGVPGGGPVSGAASAAVMPATGVQSRRTPLGVESCDFARLQSLWQQVLIELREKHPAVAPFLDGLAPISKGETRVGLTFHDEFAYEMFREGKARTCERMLREVTGESWDLETEYVPVAAGEDRAGVHDGGNLSAPEAAAVMPPQAIRQPGAAIRQPGAAIEAPATPTVPGESSQPGPLANGGGESASSSKRPSDAELPPSSEQPVSAPSGPTGKKVDPAIVEKAMKIFNARPL